MKRILKIIGIVVVVLIAGVLVFAKINRITPLAFGHKRINQPAFNDTAINGYDPLSYLTGSTPSAGNPEINYEWNGATWYFISEENKKAFSEAPEKYAPAYGGYCAFAVCKGFTANTDPETFEVIEGKLYLFSDEEVKAEWLEAFEKNRKQANTNWE